MAGCANLETAVKEHKIGVWVEALPRSGGRWLQLRYRATLYGSATRPAIVFLHDKGEIRRAMSAALFGVGEWIGRIPDDTRRIDVVPPPGCPVSGFTLESVRTLSKREVLTLARARSPARAGVAAALGAAGLGSAADGVLTNLFGATPIRQYHEWRRRGRREQDLAGLEGARDSWTQGPHIRVILLEMGENAADAVRKTVSSLERQAYPNWSFTVVGEQLPAGGGSRLVRIPSTATAGALWSGLRPSDILLPISAGDTISDYAMAALAEFASTRPDHALFYADEDSIDAGRYVAPELKPDWSPIFQKAGGFVGRAIYVRRRALQTHDQRSLAEMLDLSTWNALFDSAEDPVGHIRRVLLTKVRKDPNAKKRIATVRPAESGATATVIIPTRDRAKLMAACLASLEKTILGTFDLLIVDNGSREPASRRLLERVEKRAGVRVLAAEGPFNFSALCNLAAGQAGGRVLVFLNNDTEVMRPDWLANLLAWAVQPDVGAVGAKLVYPSGRLQHAGLVLGLGGYAAHIDLGTSPAYPGYLGRFTVPHEVSAVTGACVAVEKSKFDAVGGFDAEKYPVELGDVDLCLRLARRGWKTVFTPEAVLRHQESATRGRSNAAKRYAAERCHFLASWREAVLDDPFFHPGLSLTARRTSLDH